MRVRDGDLKGLADLGPVLDAGTGGNVDERRTGESRPAGLDGGGRGDGAAVRSQASLRATRTSHPLQSPRWPQRVLSGRPCAARTSASERLSRTTGNLPALAGFQFDLKV